MGQFRYCVRWCALVGMCVGWLTTSLAADWAWVYRKRFDRKNESVQAKEQLFTRVGISEFTQLLCSWNVLRPQKGYFSIYLQARDSLSKQWGRWHHMADWGSGVQRSFMDKADSFDQFVHVRLEVDKRRRADGFRLKVVSQDGVDSGLLKGLTVSVANFGVFAHEKAADAKKLPSVTIGDVPTISQFALAHEQNDSICSPTSCTMVTSFLMRKPFDPLNFAANVYDFGLGAYGSWPFNIAHAFDMAGGRYRFFVARLNSFAQLHRQLVHGRPVVVSVRGPMDRAPRPYAGGHLLVVTGWDAKTGEVVCNDPAFPEHDLVQQRYEVSEFLTAWERSHRLAYCVEPVV